MIISNVITILMAVFFVLGALDRLIGNKFGLGKEFERGFMIIGPMTLSILGLLMLAPVLAQVLQKIIAPVFGLIGVDTGMFPGMLMSSEISYPLAIKMTQNASLALFGGIIVGSCMGAPISFSIPLATGLIDKSDYKHFSVGILSGYIFDPVACFIGGLLMGLKPGVVLLNLVPVVIVAVILIVGMLFVPHVMIKLFRWFSRLLMAVITVGLVACAVETLTGLVLIPGLASASDSFRTIGTITISVGGALPLLFVLRKVLDKPLKKLTAVLRVNEITTLSIVFGLTTLVPGYSSYGEMNGRGKVLFAALSASGIPMLGVHLGFAMSTDPSMIMPMLVSRICAGLFAAASVYFFSPRLLKPEELE